MTWLFEDSLLVVVLGLIATVGLGFAWLQSGRRSFILAAAVCLGLTILAVIAERWVVTDREAVETVLRSSARAVERNDLEELLRHVHSGAPQIREQATAEFPHYEFDRVSIKSNLQITFDAPASPQEGTATFNVVVTGKVRNSDVELWSVPRYVVVRFRKEKGEWRVHSYEHREPGEGFRNPREN